LFNGGVKMKIEVLGSGCPKCKLLEQNTRKAVKELKLNAEIVKVTDINKMVEYGIMSSPALVVDGKVKSSGLILSAEEIKKMLR